MILSKYIDLLHSHFLTLNGHYIEMPQSNCLFRHRMSADKDTSIEVHNDDNQENDPVLKSTEIMTDHIGTELSSNT